MVLSTNFEDLFRTLNLPCMILRVQDGLFRIVDANPAFLQATGSTMAYLSGKTIEEAFPKNPELEFDAPRLMLESLEIVATTHEPHRLEELRYDIPDRENGQFIQKYWTWENVPVKSPTGTVAHILHMAHDITRQVLDQQKEPSQQQAANFVSLPITDHLQKIQEQKALLKEIAWQQSHIVRAPVARIKSLLEMFEQENQQMSREEIIGHLHASADELDGIVRKIVATTRKIG